MDFSDDFFNNQVSTVTNVASLRRGSVSAECMNPPEVGEVSEKVVIAKTDEARMRIIKSISNNLLFKNLDMEQKSDIIDAMFEKKIKEGEYIIKQGDPGDFFYVVDSGSFDVFVDRVKKAEYAAGGAFGELALMYNTPRAASIIATSDSVVWAVDRMTFRKTINSHNYKKRKLYEGFLKEIPLFSTMDPLELSKVADCLEPVEFADGETIIHQGDEGDHFYIIELGQAQVSLMNTDNVKVAVDELLQTGDYFGEMALIKHAPRAATVKAVGPLKCVSLDSKAFVRLFGPLMDILKRNMSEYKKYEELASH